MSNFVIWVSNLRILSLGLLYLWFGFPVYLCVSGFGFFVLMVVESRFAIGGGDEIGFGCGFHVFYAESRG